MTTGAMATSALARPLPHLLLPGFLGEDRTEAMVRACLDEQAQWKPALVGIPNDAKLNPEIRNCLFLKIPDVMREAYKAAAQEALPSICAGLGTPPFAVSGIEVQCVGYGDGGHYDRHSDTLTGTHAGDTARTVTLVHYLHLRPKRFSGGALRLHSLVGNAFHDVEPDFDLAVAFPSWAVHEVLRVSCPGNQPADWRFAVNVWIRKRVGGDQGNGC